MCAMNPRLLRPLASGFSPKSIADLAIWLDPSDSATITLNGSTISALADKSGNGNDATQATALEQPVLGTLNGVQAIEWDGSTSLDLAGAGASASGETFFAVTNVNGNGPSTTIFGGVGVYVGSGQYNWAYNGFIIGDSRLFGFRGLIGADNVSVMAYRLGASGATGYLLDLADDFSLSSLSNGTATGTSRSRAITPMSGNAGRCTGEFLRYTRALSDSEIDAVGNYLRKKWK